MSDKWPTFAIPLCVFFAGLFLIVGKEKPLLTISSLLDEARTIGIECIGKLPRGSVIVFDFDDTLFDPDVVIGYVHSGSREFAFGNRKALPLYKPIRQICDVLKYATAAGMYITLITARPNTSITKQIVLANFKHQKMQLHEFHANDHYPKHNNFKATLRKQIAAFRPIGLTIGDSWPDVHQSENYHWIKLPSKRENAMHTSIQK